MKKHKGHARRITMLVALGVALVALVAAIAAPAALAAGTGPGSGRNDIVRVGSDVSIPVGQTVDSVTVFGGDAVIAGTVRRTVVAVGGDVTLKDTARVGTDLTAQDTSVVAIGGSTTVDPGAVVTGTTGAWRDISSGEAVIAAAIAGTGLVVGGAMFAMLGLLALAIVAGGGIILMAGAVTFVVWLVRRDDRKRAALQGQPAYAVAPVALDPTLPTPA